MTCEACQNPHKGIYLKSCKECTLRALAGSPMAFESAKAGKMHKAIKTILQREFGDEWQAAAERMKAWMAKS